MSFWGDDMARLYWMKLKRDFFKRHDIQIIESMPNGKDYVLFYLKLLCESIDHEGKLRFSDTIPYNEDMLATITNTNIDMVRSAMKVLVSLGLIEIFDDQTIYMSEVEKMIGSETESAERMRRHRALGAGLPSHCDADVTKSDTEKEIDKDTEINREKEIESRTRAQRAPRFSPPTLEEVKAYCAERGNKVRAERFIDYYTANGWRVGRNPMKDWKAAVRTWEKGEDRTPQKGKSVIGEMEELYHQYDGEGDDDGDGTFE